MTPSTLDQAGHAAATDLRTRTRTVDTEAALAAITGSGARRRPAAWLGRPGRPVFVGAAAAVLAVAAVAGVLATRSSDDTASVESGPAAPKEAADFGPVRATVFGGNSPTLRADLHAPALLQDGDQVAVAISGAEPGITYSLQQCAPDEPGYNPAAHCLGGFSGPDGEATVGADGTALLITPAWAVIGGSAMNRLTDCRATACVLEIAAIVDDTQLADHPPTVRFPRSTDARSRLELRFDPKTNVPPFPELMVEVLRRDGDAVVAHLTGRHLVPGPSELWYDASAMPRTGSLSYAKGEVTTSGPAVTVAADGTLDVEVRLPVEIAQDPALGMSDPPEAPVDCDDPEAVCVINLGPTHGGGPSPQHRLLPEPVRYEVP